MLRFMAIVGSLAENSKHLVYDVDSNVAEHYNAAVARLIGGKRVNYCLKGSYQARCSAAVVSYNSGNLHSKLHKKMYLKSPGKFCKRYEERSKKKVMMNKLRRQVKPKTKRRIIMSTTPDNSKYYGPLCQKPDMEDDMYKEKVREHFDGLSLTEENKVNLEKNTRDQSNSDLWREERRIRLTASNFGMICNKRKYSNSAPIVNSLLYSYLRDCPATTYGRQHEGEAIKQLSPEIGKPIQSCGLFIDKDLPFLAATPDGLVDDDGIVEVKCPFAGKHLSPEEVIKQKKGLVASLFKTKSWDVTQVNKKHKYYFQVQGQLHITNRQYCMFVVWTPVGMKTMNVLRDDAFWKDEMETKLTSFYLDCILPELMDPRKRRSMPLREPQCIRRAQQVRNEKKLARPLSNKIRAAP